MSASMHIDFSEVEAENIRRVASSLDQSPEATAQEAHTYGMYMLQRYAAMKERAKTVDVEKVIEMLKEVGKDNPPDPGDEIPEDLKEWVEAQRSR
jgi:hypothetical protein